MAGRLHVEVVRVSGEIGERTAGGDDSMEGSTENDLQEHKLVCMVSSLWAGRVGEPTILLKKD